MKIQLLFNSIVRTLIILTFLCISQSCTSDSVDEISDKPEIVSINSDENCTYFWYDGGKIYLDTDNSQSFIVYKSDCNESNLDLAVSEEMPSSLQPVKTATRSVNNTILKWGITKNNVKSLTRAISTNLVYDSPLYIGKKGEEYIVSNLVYVKVKEEKDSTLIYTLAKQYGTSVQAQDPYLENWYTLVCTNNSLGKAIDIANKLYETGYFEYAEPEVLPRKRDLICSFNDQYYNKQWNLQGHKYSTNWEAASSITQGKGVTISVIDQGIDALHPDFSNNVCITYDATASDPWYIGGLYGHHGMNCVGIIAAKPNNKIGVVGMASEATILSISDPLSVRPNIIKNLSADLSVAIMSSDVVSCSWVGASLKSDMIKSTIYKARWARNNKGTIIVFASGNNYGNVEFPANCDENIIAVGGIEQQGTRAPYSNYGKELSVVAPCKDIPTLDMKESGKNPYSYYFTFSGTSSACPQVAAIAALILSVNPDLTREEVKNVIERTAQKLPKYTFKNVAGHPNGTWNEEVGYGLVDAKAAVLEAIRLKK